MTKKMLASMVAFAIGFFLLVVACDPEREQRRLEQERWNGPCQDESTLVATTAGSPNSFKCWNKDHRMRVQVTTTPSREEIGAIVFCECLRPDAVAVDSGKE